MKVLFYLAIFLFCSFSLIAQTENPNYSKELADSLGADEYGMKNYIFVILKTGPTIIEDKEKLDELFRGHMDNINRLANEGKLIVAGPFGKNDNEYRGLFVLNVKTIEEAQELLQSDSTIKEGIFEVELYNWYGSAALSEYLKVHEKIEKNKP
ncbi:MAG: hypothetical protein JW866_11370 [Ignavibacteriales bacterium]|nr:hypothetical protein [Ignavibacteriales bacterium]